MPISITAILVLRLKPKQLQRQTEAIVQIALRLQNVEAAAQAPARSHPWSSSCPRCRSRRQRVRPNAGAPPRPASAVRSADRPRCSTMDACDRSRGTPRLATRRPRRRRAPRSKAACDKVVSIEALAANRKEEIARRKRSRVDGVARHGPRTQHAVRNEAAPPIQCAIWSRLRFISPPRA